MIKRFTEMKSGTKRESGLVRSAKLLVSSVRNLDGEITKTDKTVNSVYASFSDTNKSFTESQVKKAVVAFAKMDQTLSKFFKKSYANLKTALSNDLPTDRITAQLEDISGLRAKIAILRGLAAASLGFEGADEDEELNEDLVEIDEAGYEVDAGYEAGESVADFEAEIGSEAGTEVGKEAGTEAGKEVGTEAGTEAADIPDEMKNPNEYQTQEPGKQEEIVTAQEEEEEEDVMNDIELEDSGMDEVLGDEILSDELGPVEEEEEEEEAGEMSAMATLRKKKVASSKTQKGGISDENTVMAALMEELSM